MHICVIPDLHNRTEIAERVIDKEINNVDKIIFLGDYYDNFFDGPEDVAKTSKLLKNYISDSKFEFLIGNHDLHYIVGEPAFRAITWTQEKFDAVNEILSPEDWERFNWSIPIDNWLFSHAGVNMSDYSQEKLDGILNSHIEEVLEQNLEKSTWFSPYGDFWLKYLDGNPFAADNDKIYSQVIGHTVLPRWNMKQLIGYRCYYIDTCSQHYAIVDTELDNVTINKTGYEHVYHPGEIRWINKINQSKFI